MTDWGSWDTPSTSATSHQTSFHNGDVILRSSDGKEFTVHASLLRLASPILNKKITESTANQEVGSDRKLTIISMTENSQTIEFLIRCLYPSSSAPSLSYYGSKLGEEVMNAVVDLDITSYVVHNALKDYLAELDPLRAWALAIRSKQTKERKAAVKKFIASEEEDVRDWTELRHVNVVQLAKLIQLRRKAVFEGGCDLGSLRWTCRAHSDAQWRKDHHTLMERTMFTDEFKGADDETLEGVIRANGACAACLTEMSNSKATRNRSHQRKMLGNRLRKCVELEGDPT